MKKSIVISIAVLTVAGGILFYRQTVIAPNERYATSPSPSQTAQAEITITSPKADDTVSNPITVTGIGRAFENTLAWRLVDARGNILIQGNTMTDAKDTGLFGNFTVKIPVFAGATKNLYVEVFEYSAKDGSIIHLAHTPVVMNSLDTATVKVYFGNNQLDPGITCTKVFPVEREIVKTPEIGFAAVAELLRGTLTDKSEYFTSIPPDTRLKSLVIKDGTAHADFNYALDSGIAGSCRVMAIRSQITETLKQFPTVKKVVISRDGQTDGILQP